MLRRLVSLGHSASEDLDPDPMSPSPGDEAHTADAKGPGGLASVLRGLTGSKSKSPPLQSPPQQQALAPSLTTTTASAPSAAEPNITAAAALRGLPQDQLEWLEQLRSGSLSERIAAASSLRCAIADYPLNPVLEIWDAGKDLIEASKPPHARAAGWELLTECVKYTSSTDLERREYFQTLTAAASPEDFHLQLAALEDLTNHGRNVAGIYYEIFPLVTTWLEEAYDAVSSARKFAARTSGKSKGKASASGEEKNLSNLFNFVKHVIKFNFKFASDKVVADLIDTLLRICMNTIVEDDLAACISVIDTLVTFGAIPNEKLKDCVTVLSSIHFLVLNLQKDAWHTLGNICKSHHGQSTVRVLLDVLRNCAPIVSKAKDEKTKRAAREVNGTLSILRKLMSKSVEKGYPSVPLALLIDGLVNVSKHQVRKISTGILKLLNSLFDGTEGRTNPAISDEHWGAILDVAAQCAANRSNLPTTDSELSMKPHSSKDDRETEDNVEYQVKQLVGRIEFLLRHWGPGLMQRNECLEFLVKVQPVLPDSAASLVLDYFKENRSCYPPDTEWQQNLTIVLDKFYLDGHRQSHTRLQALTMVTEVYGFLRLVESMVGPDSIDKIVRSTLAGMSAENDTLVLQETVSFLASVAESADSDLFELILESLKGVIARERAKASASPPIMEIMGSPDSFAQSGCAPTQSLSNVVTRGFTQVFLRTLNKDAAKAVKTFQALVHIARSNFCQTDARLAAMKLLFRLRADAENRIYVTTCVGSESLAASLYRTEASLARKLADDAAQPPRLSRTAEPNGTSSRPTRGISFTQGQAGDRVLPMRGASASSRVPLNTQRLWSLPDAGALPEEPPAQPSHLLFSHIEGTSANDLPGEASLLNIGSWYEALLSLFHQGCDWEVFSFVLVHLPAQLSNHPVMAAAVPQIQELRRVICEMIRMNTFQEPPSSTGLRRPDVAHCLFNSLTMVLSYRRCFQKSDEDEIVRTFMHGITDRNAKTCIHALSVCCHELPLSISKSLVTILQKMSQVITQPFVAMHILEFLACLSRLHSLYSNFRDDEYRIVFAICFRYLQYVRDRKRSMRGSHASEPSTPSVSTANHSDAVGQQASVTDDLPEYVYALAYHVITFWFLAVKMPERPNHIGWIAKNLFTDVDGSVSNEEQAQITLDFMQRVAFSDASDSVEDPLFNEQNFGEIQRKRWIIGNSIVTIKQAKESGWAEVVRRYPSGISAFTVNSKSAPMAGRLSQGTDAAALDGHLQSGTTTFPSHLLMQLLAPIPQVYDPAIRPIPLPDEEAVERAVRLFDRSSTVDGHKVGVIYIKDGQTKEAEILANTIGGPDYLEFLRGLGTLTRLKGATFNTQGLDREYDTDGQYTFCWRDRVTEIVFHVTTQMPTNLERDAQCIMKKRHIGNDFVNIIFNDSGLPFDFNTFPSEFNYVNIVITPKPRYGFRAVRDMAGAWKGEGASQSPFFMVQLMSKPGFPEISPAAEPKMVSLKALPSFVRLLALNASVFSHVWADREGGEHVSSWRNRLREINRLRERYGPKMAPAPSPPPSSLGGALGTPGTGLTISQMTQAQIAQSDGSRSTSSVRDSFSSLRRSSVATFFTSASTEQTSHRSSMLSTATTDNTEILPTYGVDAVVDSVDFSKWA
ncbi:hypothetical protein GQ53DRAFT_667733 [Thozetella sp. PMI_491]|nr:hypothetical protein GQ53DRAFT_667733 [Thozetella sp. PMI_491]